MNYYTNPKPYIVLWDLLRDVGTNCVYVAVDVYYKSSGPTRSERVHVYLAKMMIGVYFDIITTIAPSFLRCVSELESCKVSFDAHLVVLKHLNLASRWAAMRDTLLALLPQEYVHMY